MPGNLTLSEIVWGAWLTLFLVLEISAVLHWAPWFTLSGTSWADEKQFPILKTVLFGFLIGLGVHIRYGTGLLRSTLGGILVAVVVNFLWR